MNTGDVITTAEELDALPVWASVVDSVGDVSQRQEGDCWEVLRAFLPCTIVYLPGRPPRPERVVKAEALREAASHIKNLYGTPLPPAIVHSILHGLAAYAEAREA